MKLTVLRLALALAALTIIPDALAADSSGGNFFLDANVGKMSNTSDFTDTGSNTQTKPSWGADAGYRWNLDDGSSLGFDVGYMHFGAVADIFGGNAFFTEAVTASAITSGVNFRYPFGADDDWAVQARAGLMRAKLDGNIDSFPPNGRPPTTSTDSWHENGAYYGLGIERQITQSFGLILAYTGYYSSDVGGGEQINLSVDWVGLEAEFRF